ncbi:MAG: bifunctional demethylmenaquinone methyltransferase/2-methoxy-6-polyprenyl-1,4-benzoquinol methylase UbiE [Planctomycetota bacterium]
MTQRAGTAVGPEGARIRQMFAGISQGYDRANRVLSAGLDQRWRRAAVRFAGTEPGHEVLDICAGTGDLALAFADAGARVTGTDFCPEMLAVARRKSAGHPNAPAFLGADAQQLPFPDDVFDITSVAFGIRNVHDPLRGLQEMCRVTRPGGHVVVLEFTKPKAPVLGSLYGFYFRRVLPRLGSVLTGDRSGAYRYLHDSVMAFPEREQFLDLMRRAGLTTTRLRILTCGIAAIYCSNLPE